MQRSGLSRCESFGEQDARKSGVVRCQASPSNTYRSSLTWRCVVADTTDSSCRDKSLTEVLMAVELITTTFWEPLEVVGINLVVLQDQIAEVVEYARSYLSIENEEYHKVWYKLYICLDASRWRDIPVLCELCFSLLFSNGRMERIFSSLKLVKTERRTRLHHTTLSDL